jgi:hypothetical protein
VLEVPADIDDVVGRQWDRLSRPGSWFTGAERVAIAGAARGDESVDADAGVADAARRIHDAPATISLEWLNDIRDTGVSDAQYVEVLGVVSQLRAIDTFEFGVGRATRPLPEPTGGEPSRTRVDGAKLDGGWVPTVGAAYPMSVLSLAPAEHDAMVDISDAFYLAPRGGDGFTMGNMHVVRDGLTRSQIEFVAARTSLVNDCFY